MRVSRRHSLSARGDSGELFEGVSCLSADTQASQAIKEDVISQITEGSSKMTCLFWSVVSIHPFMSFDMEYRFKFDRFVDRARPAPRLVAGSELRCQCFGLDLG